MLLLAFQLLLEEIMNFMILKENPIHNWHIENKAVFEDVGQWKRPWYFKRFEMESMHLAVQRESEQTRKTAGIQTEALLEK